MTGRVYTVGAVLPVPDADVDAARRMVARLVTDDAERTQVEQMLGLAS